jgi:hypothetical protein
LAGRDNLPVFLCTKLKETRLGHGFLIQEDEFLILLSTAAYGSYTAIDWRIA